MRIYKGAHALIAGFLLSLSLMAMGCTSEEQGGVTDSSKNTTPNRIAIAICNMDKVAEELGFLQDLNRIMSNRETQVKNEILKLQSQKQMELNEKIKEYGDKPTDEQKQELAKMQSDGIHLIRQAQNQANQIINATRSSLIAQIRTKIKAPIDKIATEKGINIVVSKHPDLIVYTTDAADITTEVISAAREASLTKLAPEPASDEPGKTDGADAGN